MVVTTSGQPEHATIQEDSMSQLSCYMHINTFVYTHTHTHRHTNTDTLKHAHKHTHAYCTHSQTVHVPNTHRRFNTHYAYTRCTHSQPQTLTCALFVSASSPDLGHAVCCCSSLTHFPHRQSAVCSSGGGGTKAFTEACCGTHEPVSW